MRAEGCPRLPYSSVSFSVLMPGSASPRRLGKVAGWQKGPPEGMLNLHDLVGTSGPRPMEGADECKEGSLSTGAA